MLKTVIYYPVGIFTFHTRPDVMHILPRLPRRASPTTSYGLGWSVWGNMGVVYRLVVWSYM